MEENNIKSKSNKVFKFLNRHKVVIGIGLGTTVIAIKSPIGAGIFASCSSIYYNEYKRNNKNAQYN